MEPVEPLFGAFAAATRDAALPVPEGVCAHHGGSTERRFSIYRNNVAVSLTSALRAQFPAVERLVGAEYFSALAKLYIQGEPPRSPVLADYGSGFAPFIAAFPPLAKLPYLADVARIERARVIAYHAADAEPVSAQALQDMDEEALERVPVGLHPSASVLRLPWRALSIWRASRDQEQMEDFDPAGVQIALVIRPALEVITVEIDAAAAGLAENLTSPKPLAKALASLPDTAAAGVALGTLIGLGALVVNPARGGKGVK